MSSNDSVLTLDLKLRASRRAVQWIYLLHFVPLLLIAFVLKPGSIMMLFAAGLGVSWFWLRRHPALGFGPRAITRLVWQPNTGWQLHDASGRAQRAVLLPSTTVGQRWIIMNFKPEGAPTRTRVLAGGELPDEPLRRLRVRLLADKSAAKDKDESLSE
jgi:toxin CptA